MVEPVVAQTEAPIDWASVALSTSSLSSNQSATPSSPPSLPGQDPAEPPCSPCERAFPSPIPRVKPERFFQRDRHLCYSPPSGCYTLSDLGLTFPPGEPQPVSPLAVTAPFPLFTRECVTELRRDVLSEQSVAKYGFQSKFARFQVREHKRSHAPFVWSVWKDPGVLRAVSDAAGIDLVPIMDIELGHTNLQVDVDSKGALKKLQLSPEPQPAAALTPQQRERYSKLADEDFENGAANPVVSLHIDSYPFVAVVMLSDVSNMIGGETAVQKGDGSMIRVLGPQVGSAVMMQGRHVKHMALRTYNTPERVTMVCSFRAKDPMLNDASSLETIKYMSKPNRLNYHWSTYRLRLMSERLAFVAAQLDSKKASLGEDDDEDGGGGGEVVDKATFGPWIEKQIDYLRWTVSQLF